MKNLKNLLLLLTSCFIINCEPVLETPTPSKKEGDISGRIVWDFNGDGHTEPVYESLVAVDVHPSLNHLGENKITSHHGTFYFSEVPKGEHRIYATKTTYEPEYRYWVGAKYIEVKDQMITNAKDLEIRIYTGPGYGP